MPTSRIEIIVDGKDNASGPLRGVGAAMDTMGGKVQSVGKSFMGAGAAMSVVSAPLIGIGAAALKIGADYESSMNLVQVTSEASAAEMGKLGNLAKQLGADMQLPGTSAADAADAMVELSKAGMTVNDVMAATKGVLQLSTAAQISNADAALITARALNMFGLAGSEATKVADLLAAGANKSTASIGDMAMGLQMSGSVAKMAGLSIEDTTTALSMMANAGIAGSDAGTSLKTMLMRLMAPTDEASATMSALGVNIRDAAGNMLPMNKIIAQLTEALAEGATKTVSYGGATEAMTKAADKAQKNMVNLERAIVVAEAHTGMAADTMRGLMSAYVAANGSLEGFGRTLGGNTFEVYKAVTAYDSAKQAIGAYANAKGTAGTAVVALTKAEKDAALANIFGMDAIRAANILVDGGTESWDAMAAAVTAGGEAAAVAAAKSAGLTGALDGMKSNIETLLLNAMTPFMSTMTETGTQMGPLEVIVRKVAEVFGNLSTMIQQADPALVRAAVAIGGLIAVSGPAMLAIGAVVTAIGTLMSPIGLVIAGVIALTAAWATNFGGIRDATMPIIQGIIAQGAILVGWLQTELPGVIAPLVANIQTLVGAAGALFMAFTGGVSQLGAVNAELRPLMVNLLFLGNVIDSVVQQVVGSFNEDWGPAWNLAKMTVEQAIEGVRSIVTSVLTLIAQSISDHSTQLKALFFEAYSRVQQIIGQVLAAVSLIITSILGNIRTFIATHGDDIRTFLGNAWEQIGRIINLATQLIQATIVPIFQGIARFIQEHGDEIQKALSITWNAIKGIISFVLDLIEGIIKVALKVLKGDWAGAWEEVKKTGEKLWNDIKQVIGASLDAIHLIFKKWIDGIIKFFNDLYDKLIRRSIIPDMVNDIVAAFLDLVNRVKEKVQDLYQAVVDKINELLTWMGDLPGNLKQIGIDMIQGLIDGVGEMADAFWDAITGIILDAIQKVRDALLSHSPSLVFVQIAVDMIKGLILGIQQMTPDAVQAMAAALGAVLDSVVKALDAFARLAELPVIDDLGARLNRLTGYIRTLVAAFAVLAGYYAGPGTGLDGAAAVLDPLGEIFSKLGAVIQGIAALGTLEMPVDLVVKVTTFVAMLRSIMPLLTTALVQIAAQFTPAALLAAAAFAETAGILVAPLTAMVDAFTAVATWVPAHLEPAFAGLLSQLRRLARLWVIGASGFDAEMLEGALWFASVAGALVAPLSAMVDGFAAVATWVPAYLEPLFAGMLSQLRRLAKLWKTAVSGFDEDMLEGALWFASIAGALVAPLQAMVQGFQAVATWVPQWLEPLFAGMLSQLRRLARLWKTAVSGFDAEMLEGALWFAGVASTLAAPLKAMVDGFAAVATWVPKNLEPLFAGLLSQLRRLAALWIVAARGFDADLLTGALAFAEAASKLVSPLKAMIDAFTAVAGYAGFQDIVLPFDALVSQLRQLVPLMITAAGLFDAKAVEAATSFAEMAGKIVSPLKAMADAFTAVAGYAGFQDIVLPFDALVTQLRQLVPLMITAASLFDAKAVEAATSFAEMAGKIVSPLKAMADAFTAVAGYAGFQDIVLPFDALVTQLRQLVPLMITAASLFDDEAVQAAAVFAGRVQSLVGFIQPSVAALKALADYQAAQNIDRAIQAFITDIIVVADALREGLGNATPEMLAALDVARQFADRVQGIVGFIRPAMDAMKELRDYARPYGVGTGIVTLLRDLETLITWLNTFAGSLGANTITTAAAFAETLERIVASIEAALAGLSRLASAYSAGELVGGSWMDGIIGGLTSRLTDLETLMAYIRGLFPSSPAKHGPFRSLPDGEKFGSQWGGGLVAGLGGAIMPLTSMLAGLQSSMLSPSMVGGGSSYALSQTVNLNGTFNVREDQDIQSIAEAVGGILSQQASVNRRMNVGWAAAM